MALNMIPEKISTRFRIGIIGPGSICVTYGNALKASDTVSLACICGRDTEKDLFARPGGYTTILSKKTLWTPCPRCGYELRKGAYLGGTIYYCEHCQS